MQALYIIWYLLLLVIIFRYTHLAFSLNLFETFFYFFGLFGIYLLLLVIIFRYTHILLSLLNLFFTLF